ncbi:hypothetical protein [Nocardia mexicana]|uniref:hypothetical protein n=1 Tax=Nocardia mexicana TaxID=279262 RepID=UPI0012F4F2A3|nr:hypothetical protein [Nocardia mexicana]
MKNIVRISLLSVSAAALGLLGMGTATAAPPVAVPEPGGIIRMDYAPGEWWSCVGYSLQPPFYHSGPGLGYQFFLGPEQHEYLQFTPGADVWIVCNGTGLPFQHYGPIVKAGM